MTNKHFNALVECANRGDDESNWSAYLPYSFRVYREHKWSFMDDDALMLECIKKGNYIKVKLRASMDLERELLASLN